jgi:signal transduction histidine kinase
MYTLSGELPFKDSTRLPGVLQLPELHRLHTRVIQQETVQASVSWMKGPCQFHLVAKHRAGGVNWQMYWTKGVTTSLVFQTIESNLRAVFAQVNGKTDEIVEAELKHRLVRGESSGQMKALETPSATHLRVQDQDWIASLIGQAPFGDSDEGRCTMVAKAFTQDAFTYISGLAKILNERVGAHEPVISISDTGDVEEQDSHGQLQIYTRWRASSLHWCLSARAQSSRFELFLVRATDAYALGAAETDAQREFKLYCTTSRSGVRWWFNGLPVTADELRFLLKSAFSKFVERTLAEGVREQSAVQRLSPNDLEKQLLAQKIIAQQEQLQRQIARDLHDAVIGDVTVLKRALKEQTEKPVSTEQIIGSLDAIATRIREICYDLSPSDLRDWGLRTTLEALVDQAGARSGVDCIFDCPGELPELRGSIDLHIFRILQESVTNVIKYAQAAEMVLSVAHEGKDLVFTVKDNGKGLDESAAAKVPRQGGMGTSSIQERVGLIRVYYPVSISIRSTPGKGTITRLAITLP